MSQMFPPVRLAALDLDGTLLNHEGQVTPRTPVSYTHLRAHET